MVAREGDIRNGWVNLYVYPEHDTRRIIHSRHSVPYDWWIEGKATVVKTGGHAYSHDIRATAKVLMGEVRESLNRLERFLKGDGL